MHVFELKSKPVFDMIKKIIQLDLQRYFPEVYRLCQLIFTIQVPQPQLRDHFQRISALRRFLVARKDKIGFQPWIPSQSRKNF